MTTAPPPPPRISRRVRIQRVRSSACMRVDLRAGEKGGGQVSRQPPVHCNAGVARGTASCHLPCGSACLKATFSMRTDFEARVPLCVDPAPSIVGPAHAPRQAGRSSQARVRKADIWRKNVYTFNICVRIGAVPGLTRCCHRGVDGRRSSFARSLAGCESLYCFQGEDPTGRTVAGDVRISFNSAAATLGQR